MSQHEPEAASGWAVGGVMFAGVLMVIVGFFEMIAGLAAISNDEIFVKTENYLFNFDVTTWGWIHLVLGVVVGAAGLAVIAGRVWGGLVAIALVTLVAIANFFWIPYYPFWSILTIALAVWVIWALTRPGVYRP
jgi:hypothetical protein